MTPNETTRSYRVRGAVQGVGFRWWTRNQAEALGLRGTVRNRSDGTVEVVAAGDPEALNRFRTLLRAGPPAARVDEVSEESVDALALPDGFEIVRS